MNKNPWAFDEETAFRTEVQQFMRQSDGRIELYLIRKTDHEKMERWLRTGHPTPRILCQCVNAAVKEIKDRLGSERCRACLVCQKNFTNRRKSGAFVIWLPAKGLKNGVVMTNPVCDACSKKSDNIIVGAMVRMAGVVMPNAEFMRDET